MGTLSVLGGTQQPESSCGCEPMDHWGGKRWDPGAEGCVSAGQFLSSQKVSKEHRRRKTASRRSCLVLASPTWEGTDSEEKKHFAAFMEQLGVDDRWEE